MVVTVLKSPGCGHGKQTLRLVQEVVQKLAPAARVETIFVASMEEAARHAFPGSPTVRVNGRDIDPEGAAHVGLG